MKRCNTLIAFIFLTVIFILPSVTLGCRRFSAQEDLSSSQETQAPEIADRNIYDTFHRSMKDALTAFTDQLFFKKQLITLNMKATSVLTGGSYFESAQVLPGKDGWLFYKADTEEEHPLRDYTGSNRYTEEELAQIASNLKETQDYFLNRWGVPLYIVSIPNKEILYSEYMPETVLRLHPQSREGQLIDYMKGRPDISYFSLRDTFINAKSDPVPLYYKTDTHWNLFGSYVGLQEIFQQVYGNGIPADSSCFHLESEDHPGDLANLTGIPEQFPTDAYYVPDPGFADPAQYHDQTLLIIGDSFGGDLSEIAESYYRQVHYVHFKAFQVNDMASYQPDLVIWECVERYMDDLKDRRLMDQ